MFNDYAFMFIFIGLTLKFLYVSTHTLWATTWTGAGNVNISNQLLQMSEIIGIG